MSSNQKPWDQAEFEPAQRNIFEQLLLSLVAFDKEGHAHLVGTAFIVLAAGRYALAATARHNFEEIQRIQRPRDRSHSSTPSMFRPPPAPIDHSVKRLRALYSDGTHPDFCEILGYNAIPDLDIGFFLIKFQDGYPGKDFYYQVALDTRPLQIGESIAALTFSAMEVIDQQFFSDDHRSATLARSVDLRRGTVKSTSVSGGRSPWPSAETTIPLAAGMSGGPIFRLNADGSLVRGACALVSRDISDPEAFTSFMVPGDSTVAMIWPSVVTPVPIRASDWLRDTNPTVLDLIKLGNVHDLNDFESMFEIVHEGLSLTIRQRNPNSRS